MFSASRVVALLADQLGIDSDLSSATREERKLAGTFAHLLKEAALDSLIYDENEELEIVDPQDHGDYDPDWGEADLDLVNDLPPPDRKRFIFSMGAATLETILVAAKDYRSTTMKAHRTLDAMRKEFVAFQTDNILKLISLSFRILCEPQFQPMIQYAWFAAGYLDSPPPSRFRTPVEYFFPRTVHSKSCHSVGCPSMSFILCPLCDHTYCFKCYVVDYHTC